MAMQPTKRQAGKSKAADEDAMGSGLPAHTMLTGRINVRSMIFAPRILPMEREDCFLIIAVMVVTSSGKEVPMATSVTPMIRSEIPMYLASSLPLLTSRFAPTTMLMAPPIN